MSSYAGLCGNRSFKMHGKCDHISGYVLTILTVLIIMLSIPSPALCESASVPQSRTIGDLSLAEVITIGDDLEIVCADSVSFRVPMNAGYMIYERADSWGTHHLCLALYNRSGLDFEVMVDVFPLDAEYVTSLDLLARSLLFAGPKAVVIDSSVTEISGYPGLDLTVSGIIYDRIVPRNEIRTVFLTDLNLGVTFTLIERQHHPEEHMAVINNILSTLEFAGSWGKAAVLGRN